RGPPAKPALEGRYSDGPLGAVAVSLPTHHAIQHVQHGAVEPAAEAPHDREKLKGEVVLKVLPGLSAEGRLHILDAEVARAVQPETAQGLDGAGKEGDAHALGKRLPEGDRGLAHPLGLRAGRTGRVLLRDHSRS